MKATTAFWTLLIGLVTGVVLPVSAGEPDAVERVDRPAAVIAATQGRVWIHRTDRTAPIVAELGLRLRTGDTIRAEDDSSATIYFSGGHIVRVPAGNELEVVADPASPPSGSKRVARMSDRSLQILEEGLWLVSDPGGGLLLAAMRGDESIPESRLLSPRNEPVTSLRPTFYWSPGLIGARVTVTDVGGRVLATREVSADDSSFRYSTQAPALGPGNTYLWSLESTTDGTPLEDPVEFRTPQTGFAAEIVDFETQMLSLEGDGASTALPAFLRCAFYQRLGAWSALLAEARSLSQERSTSEFGQLAMKLARLRMEVSPQQADLLLDLQLGAGDER